MINTDLIAKFKLTSRLAIGLVLVLSSVIIAGWIFDISELQRILPKQVATPSSIAIAFFLSGLALAFTSLRFQLPWLGWLGRLLALIVAAGSLATFCEDVSGLDYGLAHSWYQFNDSSAGVTYPGPMAPHISVIFFLIGLSTLLLDVKIGRRKVSQYFVLLAALMVLMTIVGHIFGIEWLCTFGGCARVTMMVSLIGGALCYGAFFMEPETGLTSTFVADTAGGALIRRVSIASIGIPVLLLLRLAGEKADFYDANFGWALFGALTIGCVAVAVAMSAKKLDEIDQARSQAEQRLQESTSHIADMRRFASVNKTVQEDSVGALFADRYEIIQALGRGGVGQVYKAKHLFLNKTVALKLMNENIAADSDLVQRFQREAQISSTLTHPNLITVYDYGISGNGKPFLVMDYLSGESLADLIKREGRLSLEKFIPILIEMCDGLAHAHEHGVIHRDIKPGNMMLALDESTGIITLKIVDFGMAKATVDANAMKLTQTGDVFGSPLYMSPEQCQGKALDHRSDIYAIGCVMYECLTGTVPFLGENVLETLMMHLKDEPKPFASAHRLPDWIEYVTMIALEKRPDKRFDSIGELKERVVENFKMTLHT